MSLWKSFLRESLLAFGIGLGIGLALGLLFALLGALIGGYLAAVNAARSAILIAGALLLLFSALLLLKHSNLPEDAFKLKLRKKDEEIDDPFPVQPLNWFSALPRPYICLLMAVGILLVSLIPDWLLLH